MAYRDVHIVPSGDQGWALLTEGVESVAHFPTQEEAIAAGTEKAMCDGAEVLIHDGDGRICNRNSFSRDLCDIDE
jgi:hypothetical protein